MTQMPTEATNSALISENFKLIASSIAFYRGRHPKEITKSAEYKFVQFIANDIEAFEKGAIDASEFNPSIAGLLDEYQFFKRDIIAKIKFTLQNKPMVPQRIAEKYMGFQESQKEFIGWVKTSHTF